MDKKINVAPVILCGGAGTRLWPLSRTGFPKQFLSLAGQDSLFQKAAMRVAQLKTEQIAISAPLLVTGEEHRFLAEEQLNDAGIELGHILVEPIGRNTAPALTLAALAAQKGGIDPVLVVTPADQAVTNTSSFNDAMQLAIQEADVGAIVVLGITPERAETAYGYIKVVASADATWRVEKFVEKPNAITAQTYLDEGGYYWNAGIFVLKASVWLSALYKLRPDILDGVSAAWVKRVEDGSFIRPDKFAFEDISPESIDYAVMEGAPGINLPIKMVELNAGWSDLGAWDSVWTMLPKDAGGNAHVGDVLMADTYNSIAYTTSRLVSLVGVNNLVVIETPDAVLVAEKKASQDVKKMTAILGELGRAEGISHRKVYRPWGWFDSIDEGEKFKVKRLHVKPNSSLSLQKHAHRAEHWVVVSGVAEVTKRNKKFILKENQSTYIERGEIHRLKNLGEEMLEIIEVQSGDYLGEDDIVRYADDYGRHIE